LTASYRYFIIENMAEDTVLIQIKLKPEEKERLAKLCRYAQSEGIISVNPFGDTPNYTAFTNLAWTMLEEYLHDYARRKRGLA